MPPGPMGMGGSRAVERWILHQSFQVLLVVTVEQQHSRADGSQADQGFHICSCRGISLAQGVKSLQRSLIRLRIGQLQRSIADFVATMEPEVDPGFTNEVGPGGGSLN